MPEKSERTKPVFDSFVWAGFECTSALSRDGRLNLLHATRHDEVVFEDYRLLKKIGIRTVREGLSWSRIDRGGGEYDFGIYEIIAGAGREEEIQQVWDLNHFDFPDAVDIFSPAFAARFAEYAKHAVSMLRKYIRGTLYITPINEISFFAWLGADQGYWAPFLKGRDNGLAFKKALVKASIAAIAAIRSIDRDVRFIQTDPYMRRLAREPANDEAKKHTEEFNNVIRYEAWDMFSGRTYPELGGSPDFLDIIGVNYYRHNQEWVLSRRGGGISHRAMSWDSPERVSFARMLGDIYERYGRDMVVSETGSYSGIRYKWWGRILKEVDEAVTHGLPVYGVCAYPVLDRPDWAGFLLPKSGLWDFDQKDPNLMRIPHERSLNLIEDYLMSKKNRSHAGNPPAAAAGAG